jgi:hypothetical protein
MNEEEVARELGRIWSEDKHNYVLVKGKDAFSGYIIMNVVNNTMLMPLLVLCEGFVDRITNKRGVGRIMVSF